VLSSVYSPSDILSSFCSTTPAWTRAVGSCSCETGDQKSSSQIQEQPSTTQGVEFSLVRKSTSPSPTLSPSKIFWFWLASTEDALGGFMPRPVKNLRSRCDVGLRTCIGSKHNRLVITNSLEARWTVLLKFFFLKATSRRSGKLILKENKILPFQ